MAALDQNIADARAVRNVIAVNQAIRLKCDIAGLIVTQAHGPPWSTHRTEYQATDLGI